MLDTLPTDPLTTRLAEIRARYPVSVPEMVAEVVRSVLTSMHGDLVSGEVSLLSEVEALGRTISSAKAEIAALRVDAILACCETLDEVGTAASGEMAAKLTDVTTRIYEACSFQDITGQRITKVVATLKAIEEKVASIIAAFGDRSEMTAAPLPVASSVVTEASLLNGPQLPAAAMDQSEIDRLLASFD